MADRPSEPVSTGAPDPADTPVHPIAVRGESADPEAGALVPCTTTRLPLTGGGRVGDQRLFTTCYTSEADGDLVLSALLGDDQPIAELLGQELSVVGWVSHQAETPDRKTGEIGRWVRLVLILEDGRRVSLGSDVAGGNFAVAARFWGPGPWTPAKKLKIVQQRGKDYYVLQPVVPATSPVTKKK